MLDILQLLSQSLEMDPNERAPEFEVPNTPYKLRAMDNMTDREVGDRSKVKVKLDWYSRTCLERPPHWP